jgi:acetyl-CoA/propionyl-CoA carboxylase biotin carboxyl carrier protein
MARRRRERQGNAGGATGSGAVVSPMQGMVLKVVVTDGDAVVEGDLLFVVEAMKMENEIVAPREGVVRDVAVAVGAGVTTGQLLCVVAGSNGA